MLFITEKHKKYLRRKWIVSKSLIEQGPSESSTAFKKRVKLFLLRATKKKPANVVLCSHGDWIPIAIKILTGTERQLKKGKYLVLKVP
jgi:broad specificity phosphatase PhoE